jgi:IclR helix-turn-helix domain
MTSTRNQPRPRRTQKGRKMTRGASSESSSEPSARSSRAASELAQASEGRVAFAGASPNGEALSIELSRAQVDQVVRAASGRRSMSTLFSGLLASPERLASTLTEFDDKRLSRSLLAGLLVLAAFPDDGGHLGIGEVARMLGMNPSTAHRYITTLVEVGMLERDPGTRRYRLPR